MPTSDFNPNGEYRLKKSGAKGITPRTGARALALPATWAVLTHTWPHRGPLSSWRVGFPSWKLFSIGVGRV